jgi:hypothetical protein
MAFSARPHKGLDLVLCCGDCPVWHFGIKGVSKLEDREQGLMKNYLTDFAKGIIVGALVAILICGIIAGLMYLNKRDKEIVEYAEKQIELQELREDIINRDPVDFLENPDVRRAADGAAAEFDRKRDEIVERFRNRLSSRAGHAD